jgi:hypothetical protein
MALAARSEGVVKASAFGRTNAAKITAKDFIVAMELRGSEKQ